MMQALRRVTAKDPAEKLALRRLAVLELAERLGNVSEACRRGGIDRSSFYAWRRRFRLLGLDGLKDRPPIAKRHPMATPADLAARVIELAMLHPEAGYSHLRAMLAQEGRRLSAITVRKILKRNGGATRHRYAHPRTERHDARVKEDGLPPAGASPGIDALLQDKNVKSELRDAPVPLAEPMSPL